MHAHYINTNKIYRRHKQTGDMLIEALVAIVLVGVIVIGPAYMSSRSAVAQRYAQFQTQAVTQMRNLIKTNGNDLCAMSPAPEITIGTTKLLTTITCTTLPGAITVGGIDVDVSETSVAKSVQLSVTNQEFFGGSGTIVVSQ